MIQNYNPKGRYDIFEIQDNGEQYKIGEIENDTYYDLNKKGKRIPQGFNFSNDDSFWKQFTKIKYVKKKSRPLGDFSTIAYVSYWIVSILITIKLVMGDSDVEDQAFWIITSAIHLAFTTKFRGNKIIANWMGFISFITLTCLLVEFVLLPIFEKLRKRIMM
jgi:hypothetical protein